MSTHSNINVKVGDKYHSVYCHIDGGYPNDVWMMLLQYYNTQELAEKLVSLGDLYRVGESCEKPEGHSYTTPVNGYCVYYCRDRDNSTGQFDVVDKPLFEYDLCYEWDGTTWHGIGNGQSCHNYTEYVDNHEVLEVLNGVHNNDMFEDESTKVFKYFGTDMNEVQNIYNEWDVTFNTPDERMTDSYNERNRWMVRHRCAPYQGIDSDGIWHHTFFGRTLFEAANCANEYLQRAKDMEDK